MDDFKINVGIIIGGRSVEREISLISGLQAYLAIDESKYNKKIFYLDENNKLYVGDKLHNLETYKENNFKEIKEVFLSNDNNQVYYSYLNRPRKKYPIDIFIPVVHGYGMEDGTIVSYLDMYNAIYTSSNVIPSAIVQDKDATKALLKHYNIKTLEWDTLFENYNIEKINNFPLVVKPSYLGSSIGIKLVKDQTELKDALKEAFKYVDKVIIEKGLINFNEFNCAVFIDHGKIIPSAVEQVLHEKDILTFVEKYENELDKLSDACNRIIPAQIESKLYQKIQNLSVDIYKKFNLSGVVRIDYLYDLDNNEIYVNEINNIPGSLSFYLYEPLGIDFTNFIDMLIKNAIINHSKKLSKITSFKSNVLNRKSTKLKK